MKVLVTWVIFLLPVFIFGQCPDFNYYVNGTSLNCNPDEFELCITIPDGSIPSGPCLQDYVIRVSYSSINFNYTDLTLAGGISLNGGWNDVTPSGSTTTILEWEISPISTHMTGCFIGVSFGTLPTFTVELYNTANPSLILSSQTFNFSSTPTISTDMTITQAIGLGYLEDPTISSFTKQDVYIDAILTADIDYNFGAPWGLQSELTMAPGSQIVVNDQVDLGISSTLLTTCDDVKWDGILIQDGGILHGFGFSDIQNAVVGVELLDGATLQFGDLDFSNCTFGIGSFGTSLKNIDISYFTSPFFFSSIQSCETGIRLENCNTLNLLGNINFFNNKTGISVLNTNLNLTGVNLSNTELNSIEAEGSMNVNITSSTIFTSGNGLQLTDVFNTYIDDFLILDCTNGIVIFENLAPTSFEIRNSDLRNNYWADIVAEILPGSIGIVFDNNFGLNYENSAYYNVLLKGVGIGTANHLWSINDNDGMDAKSNNVSLRAINRGVVFKNDDATSGTFQMSEQLRPINFVVIGGERNIINNNDNLFASNSNILVSSSQMSQVSCNDDLTAFTSMRFYNDNSGTDIYGNEMNGPFFNYQYGSQWNTYTVTGIQENNLNLFDQSSPFNPSAKHYGTTAAEVDLSQHLIHAWNVNQGDEEYPFFSAASSIWFAPGANTSAPFCPPNLVEVDKLKSLENAITTGTEIFNKGIALAYDESTHFESTFKLYRNLLELEDLQALDQNQLAIKALLSNHISVEYVEFERGFNEFIYGLKNFTAGITDDIAEVNSLYKQTTALDIVENKNNSLSVNKEQKAQFDINQENVLNLESRINGQKVHLDNYKNNSLTALLNKVEYLTHSEIQSANNRKNIYPIILQVMQSGKANLTANQLLTLEDIASQCIGKGGESVLWARTLVESNSDKDELPELIDECLVKQELDPRSNKTNSKLLISPNPTFGIVNIELSETSKESIIISVNDQLGHKVLSDKINPGATSLILNLSHLPSGMYFISSNSESIPTTKIILNKQ